MYQHVFCKEAFSTNAGGLGLKGGVTVCCYASPWIDHFFI